MVLSKPQIEFWEYFHRRLSSGLIRQTFLSLHNAEGYQVPYFILFAVVSQYTELIDYPVVDKFAN